MHEIAIPILTNTDSMPSPTGVTSPTMNAFKKKMMKRKLENGVTLDQYDCKFGIRLDGSGNVFVLTDESEISSLDEEDVADLRRKYNDVCFVIVFTCPSDI